MEDQYNGGKQRREGAVSLVSPYFCPAVVSSSTVIGFDSSNISYLPEEGSSNISEKLHKDLSSCSVLSVFYKNVVAFLVDVFCEVVKIFWSTSSESVQGFAEVVREELKN